MADCQITCISKPHPQSAHEHITHVGNPPTWVWPRENVIASIDQGTNSFYVVDPQTARRSDVGVVRPTQGAPYLRTHADGTWNNNLLSLNQCPLRY